MKNFKELLIWQKGMLIVKNVYKLGKTLPLDERFGITSQIQRASVSIPSNISEGSSRKSEKDYHRFIEMALGSSYEVETLLWLIIDLEIGDKILSENLLKINDEEQKMLQSFMAKLNK